LNLPAKACRAKKCGTVFVIPEIFAQNMHYGTSPPDNVEAIPQPGSQPPQQKRHRSSSAAYDPPDDDDWDDRSPRPRRPGKLIAIGGMLIGGGVIAILNTLVWLNTSLCVVSGLVCGLRLFGLFWQSFGVPKS
jgi:hypothetical protein